MSRFDEIEAILTALGSGATADQFELALRDYPDRDVRTVLAERAAAGGGGSQSQTGSGAPNGVTAPTAIGSLYIDTTSGAVYVAHGVTSDDWIVVGGLAGGGAGSATGVSQTPTGSIYVLGGVDRDTPLNGVVMLSDAYAQWNGQGAGLFVFGNGTDGQQSLGFTNAAGTFTVIESDGTLRSGSGFAFPLSDPHIAGNWWDDNGVLTRSVG